MNQLKTSIAVASLVLASLAFAARDGVTFKRTIKAGTESYKFESDGKTTITMPGGGDQDMGIKSASSYSFKISDPDAATGIAAVELTSKVEKFDVDGPMAEVMQGQKDKILVTTTSTGKLDSRNRYVADKAKKIDPRSVLNGSAAFAFVSPYLEFPEKALNPGDTWEIVVPKGPLTSKEDQTLTAKFVGEKDGGYEVAITGTIKMTIDVGALLKENPIPELEAIGAVNMQVKATTQVSGSAILDKATFKTITMTYKLDSKQETELPDQNITIPSTGTSTVKITADK